MRDFNKTLAGQTYDRYTRLSRAFNDRYRERIFQADPRVGREYAFHLAHNWGNDAARAQLDRYDALSSWLYRRQKREYYRACHLDHINDGEAGRYLWCDACQPQRKPRRAA